jgi:hypothetical protein
MVPPLVRPEVRGLNREVHMKALAILLTLFASLAVADEQKEPRTLGNMAVMHLYFYVPKSLEVTYVDSYFFKDEASCKNAIPKALQIATVYASEGDMVSASCVGMTPPESFTDPNKPPPKGSTEL